jgi:hypothetical protein
MKSILKLFFLLFKENNFVGPLFQRSVVAAVSPAVVVPGLLRLRVKGFGVAKGIPTLILAVTGIDDAFSVAAFGVISSVLLTSGKYRIFNFFTLDNVYATSQSKWKKASQSSPYDGMVKRFTEIQKFCEILCTLPPV